MANQKTRVKNLIAKKMVDLDINEITGSVTIPSSDSLVVDSGGTFTTDTIAETTSATGVTIDGVLLKDGGIVIADGAAIEGAHVDAQQELTATGAITLTNGTVFLNHATVVIAATLAAPTKGDELIIIDNSATGTAAHTVTLAAGVTFDGTNDIATFNLLGEALHIKAASATRWVILANVGSVGLSAS